MTEAQSIRVQGFRASLGVRGISFAVDGTTTTFQGILNTPTPADGDKLDPSVNVRTLREVSVLRSDIPRLEDVSIGAVLRSVVLDTAFTVSRVKSPGESPVIVIECEEGAA